ncbi:type IV pilus assembly protein PilM [Alkalibacter rhizosphaerae]|uniref:Chaperone protein DnaK n=1 Tax=Alkalibacter rhizosphaerae TaxID=2815577 RepID=A0A974XFB0_9FIRM|nr:type IV pilus assembly protein PilM [Alkalibacter rhizosphaerae]QSX08646.1 type IV pilus assembly protein PilM [Alkalibacter rhizosphaerae]
MLGKKQSVTVFDFGSKNSKMVTATLRDREIQVEGYQILPTPDGAIDNGNVTDPEAVGKMVDTFLKHGKLGEARLLLSSSDVVIRTFDLPKMEMNELKEAVKYEMSVLLPDRMENYIVDSSLVDEFVRQNEDGEEVMMNTMQGVAVPKNMVYEYLEIFNRNNVEIEVVDVQSNALIKLVNGPVTCFDLRLPDGGEAKDIAIIDLGNQKTGITLLENQKLFLQRSLAVGGRDITKIISEALDMSMDEAEEWKRNNDFAFLRKEELNEVEKMLYDQITNVLYDITMEINQVLEFFISMSKQKKLDRIFLVGGGSCIPGVGEYIQRYTNIPTVWVDRLVNVAFKDLKSNNHVPFLVDAIGAVVRRV